MEKLWRRGFWWMNECLEYEEIMGLMLKLLHCNVIAAKGCSLITITLQDLVVSKDASVTNYSTVLWLVCEEALMFMTAADVQNQL